MSLFGQTALGLDVSDGTLKAVLLARNGRRAVLRRTWREALPAHGGPTELAAAVAAFLGRARCGPGTRLVLAAPAEDSVTRTFQLPVIDPARVAELARYELLAQLGLPDDDLVIRHLARRGLGEQPVHVYALRRARLHALQAALAERGIHPDAFEPPGWALASQAEFERPAADDRVLLGIGRRATDLVLLTDAGLWARHLPIGLDSGAPEQVAARLAGEVAATITGLLPADVPFRPIHVLLLEDGACDARITGALRRQLAWPLARLDALRRTRTSWRLAHEGQAPEQALSSARAFGLALSGLGLARYACPAAGGHSGREALRLLPAAALAVLLAGGSLAVLCVEARARTRELQSTLPISLLGDLQARARDIEDKRAGIAAAQASTEQLLSLARRRTAALAPRRALSALASVAAERAGHALHVERLWLDAGEPGQPGLLSLTLQASPALDATLGPRVERALRVHFGGVVVRGPERAPLGELSQWVVEVLLP